MKTKKEIEIMKLELMRIEVDAKKAIKEAKEIIAEANKLK